jgi:hypothetical protein
MLGPEPRVRPCITSSLVFPLSVLPDQTGRAILALVSRKHPSSFGLACPVLCPTLNASHYGKSPLSIHLSHKQCVPQIQGIFNFIFKYLQLQGGSALAQKMFVE